MKKAPSIRTHYDNLKIDRKASPDVIKASYETLVQKYHPDHNPGDQNALRTMGIINRAYEVLLCPQKRKEHDEWIKQQEAQNDDMESPTMLSSVLEQLRSKLLDPSGRNRLINFKHTTGKSLRFVEGDPHTLYQKLVEENIKFGINIVGIPEPEKEHWVERNGRLQRPEPHDWAKIKGISVSYDIQNLGQKENRSNLQALMYPDDLVKHCRKIEREAMLAIEETGANMLFLVLGFLEFPDQRDSDKLYTAPLVSIPVSFQKKDVSGIQQFFLQYTGDDVSENLSLREKLRNDFGLILPDLPEDQINVSEYFSQVETVIKKQQKFVLKYRVSLSLLNFSNMLLLRDLDPSKWPKNGAQNALIDHPIIREIFEGNPENCKFGEKSSTEYLVEEGPGASIPLVYDADSSQHSALVDVLSLKKNLVIEGPPGTGKSQTITNLIAACLAEGKKVLFVAEKLAALDVVKRRLSLAGLDPFILELHSNKSNKKRVLEEITKRIDFQPQFSNELSRLQEQLETYRKDLKAYTDLINSVFYNAFGLTLYQVMWRAEKYRQGFNNEERILNEIVVGNATKMSVFEFEQCMDCLSYLGSQYKVIGSFDSDCAFWGFHSKTLIPGDELKITQIFEDASIWVKDWIDAVKGLFLLFDDRLLSFSEKICGEQLMEVQSLLERVNNKKLPFFLIPKFFEEDELGKKATQLISELVGKIDRFHYVEAVVKNIFKVDFHITETVLGDLKSLHSLGKSLGVELGTPDDMRNLCLLLIDAVDKLSTANTTLVRFFNDQKISYNGSPENLNQMLRLANIILEVPEEHLYLQTPELMQDGAFQAIKQLSDLQDKWTTLERELNGYLYLDVLPNERDIKQAILTLRQGDAWYRIFQRQWYKSLGLHKNLQRDKLKITTSKRLKQLEKIIKLNELKEQWRNSMVWIKFLGISTPVTPPPLDSYLSLAQWNYKVKLAFEGIQPSLLINPIKFTAEHVRNLRREFSMIKTEIMTVITALGNINGKLKRLSEINGGNFINKVLEKSCEFVDFLKKCCESIAFGVQNHANLNDIITASDAALELVNLKAYFGFNPHVEKLLGELYLGPNTDCASITEVLSFVQNINELDLLPQIKYKLFSEPFLETCQALHTALRDVGTGFQRVKNLTGTLFQFGRLNLDSWVGVSAKEDLLVFAEALRDSIQKAIRDKDILISWHLYLTRRKDAKELVLMEFVKLLEEKLISPDELPKAYAYCIYNTIIREAFHNIPQLSSFTGLKHNQIREEFKRLDKEIIALRGKAIAYECVRRAFPPAGRGGVRVDERTEMVLLNYLMPQQRPRMSVRKILRRAGDSIQELKPCFMMGPQAVAQYLDPSIIKFDLVIMDEASQLKPEEAIGSIARGGQLVVVGDSKQLPPTSFFSRMNHDIEADENYFITTDAESILDICSSHFRPIRSLRWHYRSQHHSLIAFSNKNFYRDNLIVFPSPYAHGGNLGVRAVYLVDAVYENQMNWCEANRVVDAVIEHIAIRFDESLGVVTLNIKQRDLIADILEERLRSVCGADVYRERWAKEEQPLFIKNLENIQGDERDVIIISTTFGKSSGSRAVRQNFGPISRQGGWRRLNVLFTRAKKSIVIYTSLRPEDIVVDGKTPEGTKALRNYLEYVRTGSLTTFEETGREPDSDFEVSVMDMLRLRGYEVTPQLGVAGYRIDIAVKHPDIPGLYLAAIECDGASYHSALSVRDRDRIRQEILESLGWRGRIWRIWSTDWFRTPSQEAMKLISFLEDLRQNWKPEYFSGKAWIEEERQQQSVDLEESDTSSIEIENTILEREVLNSALIESKDELEIKVGDVVQYIDINYPNDVLTVQITEDREDFVNGVINESRPLAQTLLGLTVGDEALLHLAGRVSRTFQVVKIKRLDKE